MLSLIIQKINKKFIAFTFTKSVVINQLIEQILIQQLKIILLLSFFKLSKIP